MKVGLIQTHALGDILIALPIAQHMLRQGFKVYWPIDSLHLKMFDEISGGAINFLPIERDSLGFRSIDYFLNKPLEMLTSIGCEKIYSLYSALGEHTDVTVNQTYSNSLKFDEYKYAVTGVPFSKKWDLEIHRNAEREEVLLNKLNLRKNYIIYHDTAGDNECIPINIPSEILLDYELVRVSPLTPNFIDWVPIFEGASGIFVIDSLYANLIEQLNIGKNKHLKLRSSTQFTPVFKNGWIYL